MEMYQGKAPALHLGTALNQGVKVEEDSAGPEPEEGAGNGPSALHPKRRKEVTASVGLAPPTGLKEQWDAQWQQFLKAMEAPKLKAGNSAGSCHSWMVLPTSEGACSVNHAQQREIVPQVPFGSSEEARGPPDGTLAKRVAREETPNNASGKEWKQAQGAAGSDREPCCFREVCYEEAEGPRKVCGKLRELCYQWLEPKRHSKEEILDLVILEQFLAILPSEMQAWVKKGRPETSSLAVSLAEKFLQQQQQQQQQQTPQVPGRWEAPRPKSKESAQFPEAKQAGSKPGQEQLLKDPKEEKNYILIEEDEKTAVETQRQTERSVEVKPSGQFFTKAQSSNRSSLPQKNNEPEKRKGKCSYPLRTYENRVKTKAFQPVLMHQQDPERWEHPTCRTFDEESAQYSEAEQAGDEPGQELVFQEIGQDGHCVLIGEDGKATVEELHQPEIVVELESSEVPFREAQHGSENSRPPQVNHPEKKKDKSSNSLRTYENRAKSKTFQTVLIQQQDPGRWELPVSVGLGTECIFSTQDSVVTLDLLKATVAALGQYANPNPRYTDPETCRAFDEESAQFPEAEQAGSEPRQELMFQEITQDGHCVLIGEDGKATTEDPRRPEIVVELEPSGQSFREAQRDGEISRSQQFNNSEKRKEKSSGSLRTYEKRIKTKGFQTVLMPPQDPGRWEPPTCRAFDEESAQFPEAEQAGSEPRQELMFQEITQDGHCVLIGEDGKATVEEQHPTDTVVEVEPSQPLFQEARHGDEVSRHRPLNEAEKQKEKSSNSLRTYENRVKTKAFQAVLMPSQDSGQWEPPMCRTPTEPSVSFPEATPAGLEPEQGLLIKEIKEEESYVLIGEDRKAAMEETHQPKLVMGMGSERQSCREAQHGGEVSLHQMLNDPEKKRSNGSLSLRTNVKKIKTEDFETDPMVQQDCGRSGALICRTFSEQSAQFPETTQAGSEPGQELLIKEIKEEESYVLIAEDGKAYKEEPHQPDSFIEVELSRQLFGEDPYEDETSTYKKIRSKSFQTGPADEDEEDESECRRLFRKELDLATDEDTSSGENLYKLSAFGETSGQESILSLSSKRMRTRRKPHTCSECGKSFIYRSILFAHQRIHTGKKPSQCSDCGKTFGQQEDLLIHQRRIHASEKPYGCPVCGKHFSLLPDLTDHKRIHTGERLYRCGGERYAHLRANASDKPYACSDCGKRFVKKRELLTHQMMHTGEKPFECPSCGKCFMYRSILLAHQRMHTEENSYECLDCGKTFSVQINLSTHQRRIHQGHNHTDDPCGGDTSPSTQSADGSAES